MMNDLTKSTTLGAMYAIAMHTSAKIVTRVTMIIAFIVMSSFRALFRPRTSVPDGLVFRCARVCDALAYEHCV